ncbi:hypothetical protein Y032_1126g3648 [Ancylostoma ceylanicum]|uniref:Uncharacterized protein n=1 Tax=Ancylostoma ceylanicum TaxID=53326 RepID=A0A016W5S0_9BILA|nr:hypothetical protein Y032_1126g3648 [Ancylostoma ceylanicum]
MELSSIGRPVSWRCPHCFSKMDLFPGVFTTVWARRTRTLTFTPLLCRGKPVACLFNHYLANKADPYFVDYATAWPRWILTLTLTPLVGQGRPVCCRFHHRLGESDPYPGVFLTIGPPLTHPSITCQYVVFSSFLHRRTSILMPSSLLDGWTHQDGPILLLWTCVLGFSHPPSAEPYPYVFPTAWPRRIGILELPSRLGQEGLVEWRFHHCLAKADQ